MGSWTKRLQWALLGAATASLVLVSATALAGSGVGGPFNLGEVNSVNARSTLTGTTGVSDEMLRVVNKGSSGTAGSFEAKAFGGIGVVGEADVQQGRGVYGHGVTEGVQGESDSGLGGLFESYGSDGVVGRTHKAGFAGVTGLYSSGGASGNGVVGTTNASASSNTHGVYGEAVSSNAIGTAGVADAGASAKGIYGESAAGYAGYFSGKVKVTGYLQVMVISGAAPPGADCNSASEAGRMAVRTDGTVNLYLCRGAAGWVGK